LSAPRRSVMIASSQPERPVMRFLAVIIVTFVLIASGIVPGTSAQSQGLTDAQKKDVEALIGEYLRAHPEVILESVRAMQEREQAAQTLRQQQSLLSRRTDIERDPASPVIGNPNGDVTVTEFFDYRCGYCKAVLPSIQQLLKDDPNVRYVMKELPILSPESRIAAQLALAVWKNEPKRYLDLHTRLMAAQGDFSERRIFAIAKDAGVDVERAKRTMNTPDIDQALAANMELAQNLGINGTPAFVVGKQLAPGAIDYDALKRLVAEARKGS
jgi:protein-disulfide isomerase